MKELDLVMTSYLDSQYARASEAEKNGFKILLEMPDPALYALLLGRQTSPDSSIEKVVQCIRDTFRGLLNES